MHHQISLPGLIILTIFLLASSGCGTPTSTTLPAPSPASGQPAPVFTPTLTMLTYDLAVIADPREAAKFLINPKPVGQSSYLPGRTVTINVLPKAGWKVEEWVGPVSVVSDKTAKIDMDAS